MIVVFLLFVSSFGYQAGAEELPDTYQSEAYVLMEASTGKVIASKKKDDTSAIHYFDTDIFAVLENDKEYRIVNYKGKEINRTYIVAKTQ